MSLVSRFLAAIEPFHVNVAKAVSNLVAAPPSSRSAVSDATATAALDQLSKSGKQHLLSWCAGSLAGSEQRYCNLVEAIGDEGALLSLMSMRNARSKLLHDAYVQAVQRTLATGKPLSMQVLATAFTAAKGMLWLAAASEKYEMQHRAWAHPAVTRGCRDMTPALELVLALQAHAVATEGAAVGSDTTVEVKWLVAAARCVAGTMHSSEEVPQLRLACDAIVGQLQLHVASHNELLQVSTLAPQPAAICVCPAAHPHAAAVTKRHLARALLVQAGEQWADLEQKIRQNLQDRPRLLRLIKPLLQTVSDVLQGPQAPVARQRRTSADADAAARALLVSHPP